MCSNLFVLLCLLPLFYALPLQVSPTLQFLDSQNRERFFHGVNVVMKVDPYLPVTSEFHPDLSFQEQDILNLESWGLNIIRLGTQWPGYEPQRGQYNETYLEILHSIVNKSAEHNIYTLLDFHQDVLNEKFCGEGIPGWAVKEPDNAWAFPRPLQLSPYTLDQNGIPTPEDCAKHDWPSYHFAFETSAAYQSLYDNVDGVQDAFGEFWQRVAQSFKSNENVIGYELINEPFAGNVITNPLRLIPGYADYHNLQPMYEKLNTYIRSADDDHIIFFESVTWDDFLPVGFDRVPGGPAYSNRSVLSYHYYDGVNFDVYLQLSARRRDSQRLNAGRMCTEFAICIYNQKDFDSLEYQLNAFDSDLQSWSGWSYKSYGSITGDCGAFYDSNGNANQELVEKVSRTYAQAVSGRTKSMKYDNNTKEFSLEYSFCAECSGETEIYLNEDVHYPQGFEVVVSDATKVEWYQPKKNRVHIKQLDGKLFTEGESIQISIGKKGSSLAASVDSDAKSPSFMN